MDRQLTLKYLRHSFMLFSILIIFSESTVSIIGNVKFNSKWIHSYEFLSGHMVSIAFSSLIWKNISKKQ